MAALKNLDFAALFTEDFLITLIRAVKRLAKRRVSANAKIITTKVINYTGITIIIVIVLLEFGVNLTPILGAAGILGLAIGIASQASLSNVISGLFLVSEKPFAVGDVIRTGDKSGTVMSIDLLSVKIRTGDDLYIRIPNEKIVSGEVTNVTRFSIRRMDFIVSVAYKADLRRIREVLIDIAHRNTHVLNEPELSSYFNISRIRESRCFTAFGFRKRIMFQKKMA